MELEKVQTELHQKKLENCRKQVEVVKMESKLSQKEKDLEVAKMEKDLEVAKMEKDLDVAKMEKNLEVAKMEAKLWQKDLELLKVQHESERERVEIKLIFYMDDLNKNVPNEKISCAQWLIFLKDKQLFVTTFTICICTSSMAILEPCVPMWLLAHLNPPPSRWQLGAVFIPDSVGYFIGSHFAGLFPVAPWRIVFSALVLAGLSCCAIPLANSISQLSLPHFGLGLSVGAVDAALVPFLANLVDNKGSNQYGSVYALQQVFVSLAYAFGSLLGRQAVRIFGFPWLMRIIGFLNLMFCPLLLELEKGATLLDDNKSSRSYSTLDNTCASLDENEDS